MDRNTLTGLLLIGAILIGYSIWMQPGAEEIERQKKQQDSLANAQMEAARKLAEQETILKAQEDSLKSASYGADSATIASIDSLERNRKNARYGQFVDATEGQYIEQVLENEKMRVVFSNKGAAPIRAQLLEYVTYDSLPLLLFDPEASSFGFSFWADRNTELSSQELYFEPVPIEGENSVSFRLYNTSKSGYIEIVYSLAEDSYMLESSIQVKNLPEIMNASEEFFELEWQINALAKEKSRQAELEHSTVYYKLLDEDPDYIAERNYESENLEARVRWVSFKQQFFSAAIIADESFSKEGATVATTETNDPRFTKGMSTTLGMQFPATENPAFDFQFYFGPNHFQTLKDYNLELEDQIDLGWGIFGWVNRFLVIPVFNTLDFYTGFSYGIIILLLTLIIKLILSPLTWKNYVSSARMKALKPEIEELNAKHKDADPMKKQQAMMQLYRQAGVNPMAGCIPMLLQLPILYALFRFFPASIELRQESFLWAEDLSTYDSIMQLPFEIPFYGSHVSLFTLLMAISTFLYSKYNMEMTSGASAQMPQMKIMIYFMPFMLLFFFNSYSSGLSYYYFTANVVTMLQQFVIKKWFIDEDKIHQQIALNKKKPVKKSNFQKRLEKMAKDRGIQSSKR